MTDIKFDLIAGFDFSGFAKPTPSDYPNGRYSASITNATFENKTSGDNPKQCIRWVVSMNVDQNPGAPRLAIRDYVTLVMGTDIMRSGMTVFADLAVLSGNDRSDVETLLESLNDALVAGNGQAANSAIVELKEVAKTFVGARVAPNIVWSTPKKQGDTIYANVKGTRDCPSYLSAAREIDPASFNGDDVGDSIERQPSTKKRNLKAVRR
jgi:hypothetical protein